MLDDIGIHMADVEGWPVFYGDVSTTAAQGVSVELDRGVEHTTTVHHAQPAMDPALTQRADWSVGRPNGRQSTFAIRDRQRRNAPRQIRMFRGRPVAIGDVALVSLDVRLPALAFRQSPASNAPER